MDPVIIAAILTTIGAIIVAALEGILGYYLST